MRILLVDDDEAIREGMSRGLKMRGHEVHTAPHGRYAFSEYCHCGPFAFEAVVTDWKMPHMDGAALAHLVRIENEDQVIVFMTGNADELLEALPPKLRGVPIMRKPFAVAELEAVLDREFRSRART